MKFCSGNIADVTEGLRSWPYIVVKNFKEGRERPSTSTDEENVNQIKDLVLENHPLTVRDLADTDGISKGSVNNISKGLLCLRVVKSSLVQLFWKKCVDICETVVFYNQNVKKRIITGRETRIYTYGSETVDQTSEHLK